MRRKLFVIIVLVLAAGACTTSPPVQEMSDARQAIMAAEEAGANEFAPSSLQAARDYLKSAETKLRRKAYHGARLDAMDARRKALEALNKGQ
ncbi:MAG: DUF4398 domain-containing protein [Pseudomonadota bacterium]